MTCFRWETKKQIEKLVKTQLLAKGKASKKKNSVTVTSVTVTTVTVTSITVTYYSVARVILGSFAKM